LDSIFGKNTIPKKFEDSIGGARKGELNPLIPLSGYASEVGRDGSF